MTALKGRVTKRTVKRPPSAQFTGPVETTFTSQDAPSRTVTIRFTYPKKLRAFFYEPHRYKVTHGGRGSAKSWTIARMLLLKSTQKKIRVLCAREIQNTIKDSVHLLLKEQITALGFEGRFYITDDKIKCLDTGSEFIFKGLRGNKNEIKSIEGIDYVWVEEAEKVSKDSWEYLTPTIRKQGSEIWVSFNPEDEKAHTYTWFCKNAPPNAKVIEMNYLDNPWFDEPLRTEMEYDKAHDPDKYQHVWMGKPKKYAAALIFGKKIRKEEFPEPPAGTRFFYGCDFGFSADPTSLIRMFHQLVDHGPLCKAGCKKRHVNLYIDYEAYGHGVELSDLHAFFNTVPDVHKWKIRAESARPDTISFLKKNSADGTVKGFNIVAAEKGANSVEDGIQFLLAFDAIIIHPRCKGTWDDFNNYKWQVDKVTGDILAVPVDASNHSCDAARYALEPYMKAKTTIWEAMS